MSKQLQTGDVVIEKFYGQIGSRYHIERVTKTLAFAGRRTFKREFSGRRCYAHPRGDAMTAYDYYISTPKLEKEFKDAKIVATLKRIVWDKLDDAMLYKVAELLDIMPVK